MTDADADILLLRRPEVLVQLCDIVTYPFGGQWIYGHYCRGYKRIAKLAVAKGQGISPELWAAGMWVIARVGNTNDRSEALAIILPEVHASMCSDYHCPNEWQIEAPAVEMLKIAYMICPKESSVFPLILYSLVRQMIWAPTIGIRASPGSGLVTVIPGDLLAEALSHPAATARLRAIVLCEQATAQSPTRVELVYQAHATEPTYFAVYTHLSHYIDIGPAHVIRLGARLLNRWGLALEAAPYVVGWKGALNYLTKGGVPQLDSAVISLGDSSMSVIDYICALETPATSFFRPAMRTDMLPAGTPWSCRRHEALNRHTGANALFATFLCALARLEGPGGPLCPSHQTVWEHALESWTLRDSAGMHKAPR